MRNIVHIKDAVVMNYIYSYIIAGVYLSMFSWWQNFIQCCLILVDPQNGTHFICPFLVP